MPVLPTIPENPERMRILVVTDGYPPIHGGLEAHVQRLARHLTSVGIDVAVVTSAGEAQPLDSWGVTASSTSLAKLGRMRHEGSAHLPPPWSDPTMVRTIRKVTSDFQPDLIHAHGWSSASAATIARSYNLPLVITLHDYGMLCPMRSLLRDGDPCTHTAGIRCVACPGSNQSSPKRMSLAAGVVASRRLLPREVTFIAVSNAVADAHRRANLRGRMEVIPNFIDMPDRTILPPQRDGPILFVGPSGRPKGMPVLERAHELLSESGISVKLHHVGGSVVQIQDTVIRSGRLTGDPLQNAFDQARVVVVPSTWAEPCPTVALEAMVAGRAVVGSAVGGLLDIIDHGVTGFLVPPNDPSALAGTLGTLLQDYKRLAAMGIAGRRRVERFSTQCVGPKIEATYFAAIARHRSMQ